MASPQRLNRGDLLTITRGGRVLRSMARVPDTSDDDDDNGRQSGKKGVGTRVKRARRKVEYKESKVRAYDIRKPRVLTDARKKKIRQFVNRNAANPIKFGFGGIGSLTWKNELIKFLNEPKHRAVVLPDVSFWIRTNKDFFHMISVNEANALERASGRPFHRYPRPPPFSSVSCRSNSRSSTPDITEEVAEVHSGYAELPNGGSAAPVDAPQEDSGLGAESADAADDNLSIASTIVRHDTSRLSNNVQHAVAMVDSPESSDQEEEVQHGNSGNGNRPTTACIHLNGSIKSTLSHMIDNDWLPATHENFHFMMQMLTKMMAKGPCCTSCRDGRVHRQVIDERVRATLTFRR